SRRPRLRRLPTNGGWLTPDWPLIFGNLPPDWRTPMRWLITSLCVSIACVGCSRGPSSTASAAAPAKPAAPKLGIRPSGDTTIQPDFAKIPDPEMKKVFDYIDEHIDDHVQNLQKWIRQPSISNSGEGIPESAEMVKGFFDQL